MLLKKALGMLYSQRDIVLVPFPYSDLSAVKRRPVLVVSNNDYNARYPDILVCVITSNLFMDDYSIGLQDSDLEAGILPEISVIKCHKLFTVEQMQIAKKFSRLNQQKFLEIVNVLQSLIKD